MAKAVDETCARCFIGVDQVDPGGQSPLAERRFRADRPRIAKACWVGRVGHDVAVGRDLELPRVAIPFGEIQQRAEIAMLRQRRRRHQGNEKDCPRCSSHGSPLQLGCILLKFYQQQIELSRTTALGLGNIQSVQIRDFKTGYEHRPRGANILASAVYSYTAAFDIPPSPAIVCRPPALRATPPAAAIRSQPFPVRPARRDALSAMAASSAGFALKDGGIGELVFERLDGARQIMDPARQRLQRVLLGEAEFAAAGLA